MKRALLIDKTPFMPIREFEVVEEWPLGYFVWMIGRRNFQFPGYLPLAQEASEPYHVRTDTLKALYVGDEGLCEYIATKGHYINGYVTEDAFKKLKKEYDQEAGHNDR